VVAIWLEKIMMTRFLVLGASIGFLVGASCETVDPCGGFSLDDALHPTGSQTLASSSNRKAVYVANATEGTVSRIDVASRAVSELDVGVEPSRIALTKAGIVVSLRGERALALLSDNGSSLTLQRKIEVGAEPVGLVASEDGTRLFVANSQSGTVTELDGATLTAKHSWDVGGSPSWLALHPSGKTLFVGHAMGGKMTTITTGVLGFPAIGELAMPDVVAPGFDGDEPNELSVRITGDPSISPDGKQLYIPAFYVNNESPVPADPIDDERAIESGEGYGSAGGGVPRFNPTIVAVPLDADGDAEPSKAQTFSLDGRDEAGDTFASYPTSTTITPDGNAVAVTMESSNVVSVLNTVQLQKDRCTYGTGAAPGENSRPRHEDSRMSAPDGTVFDPIAVRGFKTDRTPRGVVFVGNNDAFVHAAFARTVAPFDLLRARPANGATKDIAATVAGRDDGVVGPSIVVSRSAIDRAVELGRRKFFSAVDPQMSNRTFGLSCSTCHFEGRNDGLTWAFQDGPRQTPSLAGPISGTEPVTWHDDVSTVQDEVMLTSRGRMGGSGADRGVADQVAAYIDWSRPVDTASVDDEALVFEGQDLFQGDAVGCSTCHNGPMLTDNAMKTMYGVRVRTRSLIGIAATAPYLHDGSMPTLRSLLEKSRNGSMGNTRNLTEHQMDALEAYLTSL
jgi:DNA-binding beta-propeller fold protein YncE